MGGIYVCGNKYRKVSHNTTDGLNYMYLKGSAGFDSACAVLTK